MLARWMELLPLFVVRWLALRYCERLRLADAVEVVMARPDVLVRTKTPNVEANRAPATPVSYLQAAVGAPVERSVRPRGGRREERWNG